MAMEIVVTKSAVALKVEHENLCERAEGMPRMLLVSGASGAGKTTALRWLAAKTGSVYTRALATDTAVSFLSRVTNQCGLPATSARGNSAMTEMIADHLEKNERTLIVDEGDFLFGNQRLVESLRDIHDLSGQVIVVAGYSGIEKRFANRPQIYRRVARSVEVPPLDLEDAKLMAKKVAKVTIAEDLLTHLLNECNGNAGLIRVGFDRTDHLAAARRVNKIDRAMWGRNRFYLTHRVQE